MARMVIQTLLSRGKSCTGFDENESPLRKEHKEALLAAHNEFRNKVALGQETRGLDGASQPPAANMIQMVWDNNLADNARRWAIQCKFGANNCAKTSEGEDIGQLVVEWVYSFIHLTAAVKLWASSVLHSNSTIIASVPLNSPPSLGTFTQIVWSTTSKLGCGRAIYRPNYESHKRTWYLVCNYFPRGNIGGKSVYKIGEGCSACPYLYGCSTQYPGLCVYTGVTTPPKPKPHTTTTTEPAKPSTTTGPVLPKPDKSLVKDDQVNYVDPDKYSGKRCRSGSTFNTNLCAGVATLCVVALLTLDYYVKYGFN